MPYLRRNEVCLFFCFSFLVCVPTNIKPRHQSCSLGCTKSHKINCAPKPIPETAQRSAESEQQQQQPEKPQVHSEEQEKSTKLEGFSSSEEAQKLFAEYPGLRAKLREIYKTTQEEEWNSASLAPSHNRYNNYKHHNNNRPPPTWTAERGFNRGLGKVRKWREGCEGGDFTDSDAEGFMKFIALAAPENEGSQF